MTRERLQVGHPAAIQIRDATTELLTPASFRIAAFSTSTAITDRAVPLYQTVDLITLGLTPAQLIGATANYDFFEQSLNQGSGDIGGVKLTFFDSLNNILGTATSGEIYNPGSWLEVSGSAALPLGTTSIDYQMFFILHAGSDLDAFIDDNSLTITTAVPEPCSSASFLAGVALLSGSFYLRRRQRRALAVN